MLLSESSACHAQQLDKSMHRMMAEKERRQEQIRQDELELAKLDTMVKSHIQPNLVSGRMGG